MISHQILYRALLDYNKTIIRGGRGDKMKEVTRQIAEAIPTKYHTSYVKMQGHDKQKKGSFWGGYGSSELGEVPVLSCKKPRYGKGNHFIKARSICVGYNLRPKRVQQSLLYLFFIRGVF